MKRTLFALTLAFVVLASAFAQAPSAISSEDTIPVRILKGNVPWRFAGPEWRIIVDLNPELKNKVVEYSADDIRVTWEEDKIYLIPIRFLDKLQSQNPGATEIVPAPPLPSLKSEVDAAVAANPLSYPITGILVGLFALVAAIIYFALALPWWNERKRQQRLATELEEQQRQAAAEVAERNRQLALDPVTSGTPYVPGGIQPTETARLEAFFDDQAVDMWVQARPGTDRSTLRAQRIGPIEHVMLSGEGMVGYLNPLRSEPRRFDPPIEGYQARYRMPNGTESILQSLRGCMNPIENGEFLSGFTATLITEVVSAPVAPVQPTPIRPVLIPATTTPSQRSQMTVGSRKFSFPVGAEITVRDNNVSTQIDGMIVMVGADGNLSVQTRDGGEITVESVQKLPAAKRKKLSKSAATGGAAS